MTAPTPQPPMPDYAAWRPTCDTLHGHAQILGKLAAALAPREPGLGHLALRLTARGIETRPLPCPDGSGVLVVALDLRVHEAVLEHSDGRGARIPLTPHRSVGRITRAVMDAVGPLAGGAVAIDLTPQEVPWTLPLDRDEEHATYDPAHVAAYFAAATHAATVLGAVRAVHRGPATPVDAWWGSFDIAVGLTVAGPPAREAAIGWWPGDTTYPRPAWYGYVTPPPDGIAGSAIAPSRARWDPALGEFLLDWADAASAPDPTAAELAFAASVAGLAGSG